MMKPLFRSDASHYYMRLLPLVLSGVFLLLFFSSICFGQEDENSSETAVELFNQGQDLHEKGELEEAIKLYKQAIEIIPEFPEAEYQCGNAYLQLGKIDFAESSFRRAVELRDDWTLALAGLGSVLIRKRQFPEAEKVLSKALTLDDLNFPALAAMSDLRLKTKAPPEVLRELLTKITALTAKANPAASIWAARAALEDTLGDKKSAKASSEKAIGLDPKNQSAIILRTELALAESDPASAEIFIRKLEDIAPKSENVLILRARFLTESGKPDEAVQMLNTVENPSTEILAIRDKLIASTSVNAIELEKQLETNPANPVVLGRLCVLNRIEDPAKALNFCRRASEAEPNNINHAIGYGGALVQAKHYLEAVALFRRLLVVAPDNSTVHANLGTALFQLKRFQEAKSEYLWLVEKQPGLATAYYFLAIAHDQLGEYLDAMANYQQFLRLADPDKNKLETEMVNLRLPVLQKQIRNGKGKRNGSNK